MILRRTFLGGLAASATPWPALASTDPAALVRAAFLFAYPVQTMLRTRAAALARVGNLNRFNHRRSLSGAADRAVTTPNNDTLYSAAWLDLSAGPLLLTMPAAPQRYHSAAFLNLFTDNDAVLGTRTTGGRGGRFLIVGPGWRGTSPRDATLVRLGTNDAWLIVRVLVNGPADLAAAQEVQSRFILEPLAPAGPAAQFRSAPGALGNPAEMLEAVNEALGRGPVPAWAARRAASLRRVGIEPGRAGAFAALPSSLRAEWLRQAPDLLDALRGGMAATGIVHAGWSYPRPGLGEFGNDDLYRSRIALGGLAALPLREATYLTALTDARGEELTGARRYALRVPARVPTDAFWSLSMYEVMPDGRFFFTPNPIDRYTVGDRTADLIREPDGAIRVAVQHVRPVGENVNWLPAPPGRFAMSFRAYLPRREMLDGRFRLPALTRV